MSSNQDGDSISVTFVQPSSRKGDITGTDELITYTPRGFLIAEA